MNKRLELVNELQDVEQRKADFNEQLKAVESYYLEKGTFTIELQTNDFKHKGVDTPIAFTKDIFVEYLKREIAHLEKQSERILNDLTFAKQHQIE